MSLRIVYRFHGTPVSLVGGVAALCALCFVTKADEGEGSAVRQNTDRQSVPIWVRFEAQLRNDKVYANPFRDVVLNSRFTSPTEREIRFLGFYDGDGSGSEQGDRKSTRLNSSH